MSLAEHITKHQIPHNYIQAIQAINGLGDLGETEYSARIQEITGTKPTVDPKLLRHTYLYLVQEGIKEGVVDIEVAVEKATTFTTKNPWSLARDPEPVGTDAAGNPKQKKGAKKDQAVRFYTENKAKAKKDEWTRARWITELMAACGLTSGGASTYYANLKAGRY